MTLQAVYDTDNIFAKILRGELPCVPVYDDDVALGFMDVFPQTEGHTLIVPKGVQACNLFDMPDAALGPYMQRVQKIARAVMAGLQPDGVVITQFNGAMAGQSVFHLHFHVIPRYKGVQVRRHAAGRMADTKTLEKIANRIRHGFG